MPPREVAHRLREKCYTEMDRISAGRPTPRVGIRFREYWAGAPRDRFYPGIREVAQFSDCLEPRAIVEEAERLCRHEFQLLGHAPVSLGPQIDWHCDPITGRAWERRYWADYRPVENHQGRDIKNVHELNRQQHLPRLAKAYRLTGDPRYAAEAVAQMNSWIEQNPPRMGINWQSSLEIALRAISWLWTIFLLEPCPALDEESAQRIGESLFAQLEHVYRYTSLYSSPNTHLIGEATALFIAGLVFRDQKRPAAWLRRGAALLSAEISRQVLRDGVYGELSSYYHCYALDFYLQALILAEQNQFPLGVAGPLPGGRGSVGAGKGAVRENVERMLDFVMQITRPDGTIPLIGDDDGGRALALRRTNYRSYQDGLCLGALLYSRPDFKHQAGGFAEEAFWLLGSGARDSFERLESAAPAETCGDFAASGLWVQRSGWGGHDSHLVFDRGGLGMLSGGHSHADALSIALFSGGRELLVDPGTFVYNSAPESRDYFRSTRAHNTVTIDGVDQAEQGGTFQWRSRFSCRSVRAEEYVSAEHNGYSRLPGGVIHRRRLVACPDYWIALDEFSGAGAYSFDFHYHFAPGLEPRIEQVDGGLAARAENAKLLLTIFGSKFFTRAEKIAGWASRLYGEKRAATALRATMNARPPASAITFLVPAATEGSSVRRLELDRGDGIACIYRHGAFEDIAVLSSGNSLVSAAGFWMRGEFFWLRLERGVLRQIKAIRAYSLDCGGVSIFGRSEPGPYSAVFDCGSKEEIICAESVGS